MVNTDLIKKIGGFSEKLHRFEDRDFFIRSLNFNCKYVFVDNVKIRKKYDRRSVIESFFVHLTGSFKDKLKIL